MKNKKVKAILLTLLIFTFLIPISQVAAGQELSAGAKLVGTTPFVFAEARLWIFSLELGAGLATSNSATSEYGYETGPIDFSLGGKIYPIEIMGFSPYVGYLSQFSTRSEGLMFKQSREFAGAEFDFPGERLPLSAFAGGGMAFTEAEGAGLGWHLGVKYIFSI